MVVTDGVEKLTYGAVLIGAMARINGLPLTPVFDEAQYPSLAHAVAANTLNEDEIFVETLETFLYAF